MRKLLSINAILVLCAVLLAIFPMASDTFYMQLITKVMIMAIFALSLDLLVGYTGLVSFGHAAYYGLSGYALAMTVKLFGGEVSMWWTLPAAMVLCALFALITGTLVLRTRGIFFIMVTLAFAQMLYFVFHDTNIAGGSDGMYMNFKPTLAIYGVTLLHMEQPIHFYYLVLFLLVVVYLFLQRMLGSTFGRALMGIKVNEHRMRTLGFPIFRYQLASYVIAGALAGLAGYLTAVQFGQANPELLSWHLSGAVLMMVIMGGMGTLYGPVIGAFVFVLLQEILADQAFFGVVAKHWQLTMGIFIVLVALYLPLGIAGLMKKLERRQHSEDKAADGATETVNG